MLATQALTQPIRDFATTQGTYTIQETTVGEYLERLSLYDPATRLTRWDTSIMATFQRAVLPISQNPIKRRMFRDLLRGGTLPPIVLYERAEGQRPHIVDGLQRTHVQTTALDTLLVLDRHDEPENFAQQELNTIHNLNQDHISAQEFLERPVILQVWQDLEADELVRLFMVLNVGQQRVSPRHLLEVMGEDLRRMFEGWGLRLMTEREEKEMPQRRGRKKTIENTPIPGITHFRYEYLLDGLGAYVARNPHIRTTDILQSGGDTAELALEERVTEIGSELCRADFIWVCQDLNKAISERYETHARWRVAIQNSDNFFIPLMAALGDSRNNERAKPAIEDRKRKLIELIQSSTGADPLWLSSTDSDSLSTILDDIRSNIGRRRRGIVFNAWRRYFRFGPEEDDYPVGWRTALLSD